MGVAIKDPSRVAPRRVDGELICLGWTWADSHQSSEWLWLRNVSTSETPAKGDDYRTIVTSGNGTSGATTYDREMTAKRTKQPEYDRYHDQRRK